MKAIFIIGPSGSGKTTIAKQLKQIYTEIFGKQNVLSINLDAANCQSHTSDIDINELITIEDIMEEYQLGPNGSLLFAMQFLKENIKWLIDKLQPDKQKNMYLIFDLPGQIELYINHEALKEIVFILIDKLSLTPCILEIFDSTFICEVGQFTSLCMMSLATIINLELPHLNILNKIDTLKGRRPAGGMLNDYICLSSMRELVQNLSSEKDKLILDSIAIIVDSFGQVGFLPYSAYKSSLMGYIIYDLQRIFGTLEPSLLNKKFEKAVEDAQQQFSKEKLITVLQNELFDESDQFQQDLRKDKEISQNNKTNKQK